MQSEHQRRKVGETTFDSSFNLLGDRRSAFGFLFLLQFMLSKRITGVFRFYGWADLTNSLGVIPRLSIS